MELSIKQRWMLVLVVIALAVIFIPTLMNNSDVKTAVIEAKIPTPPAEPISRDVEIDHPQIAVESKPEAGQAPQVMDPVYAATSHDAVPAANAPKNPEVAETSTKQGDGQGETMIATNSAPKEPQPEKEIVIASKVKPEALIAKNQVNPSAVNNSNEPAKAAVIAKVNPAPAVPQVTAQNATKMAQTIVANVAQQAASNTGKNAWAVQLGSFSQRSHALALQEQLRKQGITTYLREVGGKDKPAITRVYIGPETNKERAQTLLASVKSSTHMNGIIVPFEPMDL